MSDFTALQAYREVFPEVSCFLRQHGVYERGEMPPCDGWLRRVHLIPRQLLKREGAPQWDDRVWVWACGGPTGIGGHHGMLDSARTLRIPRAAIPGELEVFAVEHGLAHVLDRLYPV